MTNTDFRTEILTNCVKEDALRYYMADIVGKISEILSKSYGPFGSHTLLKNGDLETKIYSKDGKTILDNIRMTGEISDFILNEFKSITNHIASNVGDATTTVVLLSHLILQRIFCVKLSPESGNELDLDNSILRKYPSSYIINAINKVTNDLKDIIIENKQDFDSDKAYHIAYTASNGNVEISKLIKDIYDDYGNDIYLEPKYSLNGKEEVRVFDGTTLDYPMRSPIFINNNEGNCIIDNPKLYFFKDAIDTKEMIECVATIVNENIIKKDINNKVPTVIIAPRFSRDFDIEFTKLFKTIENLHNLARPPLCFIEADHDLTGLDDIRNLSGATFIAKYLTSDNKVDYNNMETLNQNCGTCEKIIIDGSKTMFKGIASKERFKEVIEQLKLQITNEERKMNPNHSHISSYMKRINKLTSQVIEIYINSISTSDKCNKFLVYEDVCTSVMNAAKNGVGRAASYELYNAVSSLNIENYNNLEKDIYNCISSSTISLISYLISTSKKYDDTSISKIFVDIDEKKLPYNIITSEYDHNLLTTIMSDIEILNSISVILSNLITTNQMLISSDVEALSYNNILNK